MTAPLVLLRPGERLPERCPACERFGVRARERCRTCQGDGFVWAGDVLPAFPRRPRRAKGAPQVYPKGAKLWPPVRA